MKKTIATLGVFCSLFLFSSSTKAASFHVAHTSPLSWQASYDISTKGNNITNVHNVSANAFIGQISTKKIIHSDKNKVTLSMIHSVGTIKYHINLTATIKDKKIIVTTT